ncbi:MAG: DnaJ domain-containing protein, partial [Dehalococcoidia bacterium]
MGIDGSADDSSVKRAYRTLAMKFHPDRNPGDAQAVEKMKEINEAYAILSDPEKRRLYDTYGHAGLEGYTQEDIFRGVDFADLFREFGLGSIFGSSGGLFDSFFGGPASRQRESRKGADLRYDLDVTLEEVAQGTGKTVELTREAVCPGCRGTGAEADGLRQCNICQGTGQEVREQRAGFGVVRQITTCRTCRGKGSIIETPCNTCQGAGVVEESSEIKLRIPPGAGSGHTIHI